VGCGDGSRATWWLSGSGVPVSGDLDEIIAHRHEQPNQLVLLRLGDVELVQRPIQMLHDNVELAGRGAHPGVCLSHAPAGVGAQCRR